MKEFLRNIHPINNAILDEYLGNMEEFHLPKKTIMTAAGEVERYLYFVIEGVQKSYYLADNKQHIIAFAYAPSFSGVPESFFTQTPSRFYLETIKDSRFLRINYETHIQLLNQHREIETLYRKALEQFLAGVIQRQYELMALDIETRFRVFMERSAHLLQLVPHKDIAAYLRIDATNFSKLLNTIPI